MTLNDWTAETRKELFAALSAGRDPAGEFDRQTLNEGRTKGKPQFGSTRYEPDAVVFEFIFPDARSAATILDVRVRTPDRVVWLPVPPWVIEQIWQGEITGSHHFAAQAREMLDALRADWS
jgi:hypothetical protein